MMTKDERKAELERNIEAMERYLAAVRRNPMLKVSPAQTRHIADMQARVDAWKAEVADFVPFELLPGVKLSHVTAERDWDLVHRQGTAWDDKWTLIAQPIPGEANPAAQYENGQYKSMEQAYAALNLAISVDDGTHVEN